METDPQTNSNFSKNSPSMVVAMALYLVASEIMYQGYNSSVNSMKIMNKIGVILSEPIWQGKLGSQSDTVTNLLPQLP